MLLSEVLLIASELKLVKPINESYKSSIISKLINPINLYSKIDYSSKSYMSMFGSQSADSRDLVIYRYKRMYKDGDKFIHEFFNDPEKRATLLNYILYKKETNFIKEVNKKLKDTTGIQIDIANISDDQIEVINDITLTKKKPYKSSLQFWVDNYRNTLIAITCNNKIIAVCNKSYSNTDDFPLNNKNYVGDYTLDQCNEIMAAVKNNDDYTAFNEFLSKAYKFIPKYNYYTSDYDLKKELETVALSMNKLMEYFNNQRIYDIKVYAVNTEGMELNNITDKMILREEYKKFLHELACFLTFQRQRYKKLVDEIKGLRLKSDKFNKINELYLLCIETFQKCMELQSELLTKPREENKITGKYGSHSMYIPNTTCKSILFQFFERNTRFSDHKTNNNSIYSKFVNIYRSKRDTSLVNTFDAYTKIDLIIFTSVMIEVCMDLCIQFFALYKATENADEENKDVLVQKLNEIKGIINKLDTFKKEKHIDNCIIKLQNENFTDIANDLTKIKNFTI